MPAILFFPATFNPPTEPRDSGGGVVYLIRVEEDW